MTDLNRIFELADGHLDDMYHSLESLCICFPGRISGSEILEQALDFLMADGRAHIPHQLCTEEPVSDVPCWQRGDWREETCVLHITPNPEDFPAPHPIRNVRVLANGLSVGTGPQGISGDVVIVNTWDELNARGLNGELKDKIVWFDYQNFKEYALHVGFRTRGAHEASKFGAKAVLVRSMTLNTSVSGVHTGTLAPYPEGVVPIPAACVSVQDTELVARLAQRGHKIHAHLYLPCFQTPSRVSRNLIFEIKGSEHPEEVVIVGGHTDSWDCQCGCCQGAHDDGQGVIVSLEIIKFLHKHNIVPKRTIRAILFVDEEILARGGKAYAEQHKDELDKVVVAVETDLGVGPVCGFGYCGTASGRDAARELLAPLSILGHVNEINEKWPARGVDIAPMIDAGKVPGLLIRHESSWWDEQYWEYHHTVNDTIDTVDKAKLLLNFKVLLGTVLLIANSDVKFARE